MVDTLKALVVGGGVGGMAASIALAVKGFAVDLVEIDPQWKVLGAGITITGPTLRAFKSLGIIEEVAAEGYFSPVVELLTKDGALMGKHIMPPLAADLPAAGGILRPVLHRILADKTRASGTHVRLGMSVEALVQDAAGVDVTFSDGSQGRYDCVIGADGLHSRIRAMIFPDAGKPEFTGQGCWRVLADRPAEIGGAQMYYGADCKAGVNPCSPDKMYMFVNSAMPGNPRVDPVAGIEMLRALLGDFGGAIADVRAGLGPDSAFNYRPLEALLLPLPWSVGRVGLIGDAAHATTPHLASGAGLAIEDGLVLAEELTAADSVAEGWRIFAERRWERARLVVETSVELGAMELAHADGGAQTRLFGEATAALAEPI